MKQEKELTNFDINNLFRLCKHKSWVSKKFAKRGWVHCNLIGENILKKDCDKCNKFESI